ncbi:MAG: hypothetical protein JWM97_2379 [Phycisphaerales bacterium]|nr:hypothetical protein [Phycisphaerales bacterium]
MPSPFSRQSLLPEPLEPRTMLSSAFPNINLSRMPGSQAEGSIVVDRADPTRLFAVSNLDVGDGLTIATSNDGGTTWSRRTIANDSDHLPPACCDPSAGFDAFGNLFLVYLDANTNHVVVLLSTDAGQGFSVLDQFHGKVDQPTLTTGPGGVWVTFQSAGSIVVTGAVDTGLGAVGSFLPFQHIRGSADGNFGDIAVGPSGQVMVTYQKLVGGLTRIYTNVDPDGLGPAKFGKPIVAAATHVGYFDYIPAQATRGIDAETGLVYDSSGGPFTGRAYLVYTDETPAASGNTDIYLRYSDNNGKSWSNPIRVNDDSTLNSQFLPRIALDNSTGNLAVGWYDARNDLGAGGPGDTNKIPNDDAQYFATLVTPLANGVSVAPNQQISAGTSNASHANNSIDLGDYTGLDFLNGVIHPLWFDNSNSTGDNPDGALKNLDVYTANVSASSFAAGSTIWLGGMADPSGPVAALSFSGGANPGFVKKGKTYVITVTYADAHGISLASVGGTNLLVTGPNGFTHAAQLVKARPRKGGVVLATYKLINPAGNWVAADAGTYVIDLQPGQVLDGTGHASSAGMLGSFAVAAGLGSGSHSGAQGPRHSGGDADHH